MKNILPMLQFKDKRLVKFGADITALRIQHGFTLADVTKKCSLSIKDVQAIKSGTNNFGFTTLLEVAQGLGVSPLALLTIDFYG